MSRGYTPTIKPKKELPSRWREEEEDEKILAAYPPTRFRGKAACLARIEEEVKEGNRPEDLLQALQAYATDSAGSPTPRTTFRTTGFSHGAGKDTSRISASSEKKPKLQALTTMRN